MATLLFGMRILEGSSLARRGEERPPPLPAVDRDRLPRARLSGDTCADVPAGLAERRGAEVYGLRRAQQDNLPAPLRDPSYGRAWRNPSLSAASWFRPHPGAPPGSPFIICRPDCAARRPWISPRLSPSARPARRETIWALRDGRIRRVCCWRREWNLRPARIEAFVEQEMERVRTWASAPCIARDDQRPGFAFPA